MGNSGYVKSMSDCMVNKKLILCEKLIQIPAFNEIR